MRGRGQSFSLNCMENAEHTNVIALLTAAADALERWPAGRYTDYEQVVTWLEELLAAYNEEIQIWQHYQDTELTHPLAAGPRGSIAVWIGAPRAQRLAELNKKINDYLHRIAMLTDIGPLPETLDEAMLRLAERHLPAGAADAGPYAARRAIKSLEERVTYLHLLLDRVRIAE